MKISILISGKQGSGKTTRMNQILSNCKKTEIKEISPEAFLSLSSDKFNSKFICHCVGLARPVPPRASRIYAIDENAIGRETIAVVRVHTIFLISA